MEKIETGPSCVGRRPDGELAPHCLIISFDRSIDGRSESLGPSGHSCEMDRDYTRPWIERWSERAIGTNLRTCQNFFPVFTTRRRSSNGRTDTNGFWRRSSSLCMDMRRNLLSATSVRCDLKKVSRNPKRRGEYYCIVRITHFKMCFAMYVRSPPPCRTANHTRCLLTSFMHWRFRPDGRSVRDRGRLARILTRASEHEEQFLRSLPDGGINGAGIAIKERNIFSERGE